MRKIACTIKSWHGRAITLALSHDEYIYIGNLSVDFSERKKKKKRIFQKYIAFNKFYIILSIHPLLLFIIHLFPVKFS